MSNDLTYNDVKPLINLDPIHTECDRIEAFFMDRYNLNGDPSDNFDEVQEMFKAGVIVDYEYDLLKHWAALRNVSSSVPDEFI